MKCIVCGLTHDPFILTKAVNLYYDNDDDDSEVPVHKYCIKELLITLTFDPNGKKCGKCGGRNLFCDDCGWFYIKDKALCENCYKLSGHMTAER